MLFYVNKIAQTPYGKPLLDEDQQMVSFAVLMFTALVSNLKTDVNLSVVQKRNIYRLKQRLALVGDEAPLQFELSAEDIVIIRQRAADALSIDLFGQIDELLDKPIHLKDVSRAEAG